MCSREASKPSTTTQKILSAYVLRFRERSQTRELDVVTESSLIEGNETHFFINRLELLETTVDEIMMNDELDPRFTLCVNYHGEGKLHLLCLFLA